MELNTHSSGTSANATHEQGMVVTQVSNNITDSIIASQGIHISNHHVRTEQMIYGLVAISSVCIGSALVGKCFELSMSFYAHAAM